MQTPLEDMKQDIHDLQCMCFSLLQKVHVKLALLPQLKLGQSILIQLYLKKNVKVTVKILVQYSTIQNFPQFYIFFWTYFLPTFKI